MGKRGSPGGDAHRPPAGSAPCAKVLRRDRHKSLAALYRPDGEGRLHARCGGTAGNAAHLSAGPRGGPASRGPQIGFAAGDGTAAPGGKIAATTNFMSKGARAAAGM